MARPFLRPESLAISPRERALARTAGSAAGTAQGVGGAIGAGAGGALGALGWLVPGLGAITMPLGASVGGSLGGAIGGSIGGAQATAAEDELQRLGESRAEALTQEELRQRARIAFLNREAP